MAVYTEVSFDEAQQFLLDLELGSLHTMAACSGGIENTNYFVTTDQAPMVLTLFERLNADQLPFYLRLMKHLAAKGIPVPDPTVNAAGEIVHNLHGKPAAVVNRLKGKSELAPSVAHCVLLGDMLAKMHVAGKDFALHQPNLRGLDWWNATVPVVLPFMSPAQADLLRTELAYQNHQHEERQHKTPLPQGAIHADLFRDNALFDTNENNQPVLTGFFDFYFAGVDTWLFDIAVCLNDWCIDHPTGAIDPPRARAFLQAYGRMRPLEPQECLALPDMGRAAALRFWISRLWDFHLPREAAVLQAHDPAHFYRVLQQRIAHPLTNIL